MTTAILDVRPAVRPAPVPTGATTHFVRLFALDRVNDRERRLVCHWRRDGGGRLACFWELELAPAAPLRAEG